MTNKSLSIANVVVGMANGPLGPTGATGTPGPVGCAGVSSGGGGGSAASISTTGIVTLNNVSTIAGGTYALNTYNDVRRLHPKNTEDMAYRLPSGKVASISHAELIKYIGERDLRQNNEIARSLWDRYQAAVKLIWSDDDEQET